MDHQTVRKNLLKELLLEKICLGSVKKLRRCTWMQKILLFAVESDAHPDIYTYNFGLLACSVNRLERHIAYIFFQHQVITKAW